MSSTDFPIYPEKGDYVRFRSAFSSDVAKAGDIGYITSVVEKLDDKKEFFEVYLNIFTKKGLIFTTNFSKNSGGLEIIKTGSPTYKVLYGKKDE